MRTILLSVSGESAPSYVSRSGRKDVAFCFSAPTITTCTLFGHSSVNRRASTLSRFRIIRTHRILVPRSVASASQPQSLSQSKPPLSQCAPLLPTTPSISENRVRTLILRFVQISISRILILLSGLRAQVLSLQSLRTSSTSIINLSKFVSLLRRVRTLLLFISVLIISPRSFQAKGVIPSQIFSNPGNVNLLARFATVFPMTVPTPSAAPRQPPEKNLVIVAGILFVVSAALAAAETAITTLWPWKVRELADREGPKSPFTALEGDLTRFLTTILVSTTSATVFSTAIATELAGHMLGPTSVPFITAGLTVIFLFFGEILPKALAVHAPAKVARLMVPVISLLSVIVYPVGKLLAWLSTRILKLMKLPMESDATVSEEELRLIVAGADQSGSIEKYESQIIRNVLDLEETDVREVMRPRVDIVAIASEGSLAELLEMEREFHYSRMPVFENTVDNIVGIVMAKSLLTYLQQDTELLSQTRVSEIADPAFFVPESMSVWVALEEMRKRRLHMAIVVDEYGGTAGLVTLEDILEEVVGEIYDEDDDVEAERTLVQKLPDGKFLIDGQAEFEKVEEALKISLTKEEEPDFGTISGFLCAEMGGIPDISETLTLENVTFTVVDADDRRVKTVRAEVLEVTQDIEEDGWDNDGIDGGNSRNYDDDEKGERTKRESSGDSSENGGVGTFFKAFSGEQSSVRKIINSLPNKENAGTSLKDKSDGKDSSKSSNLGTDEGTGRI